MKYFALLSFPLLLAACMNVSSPSLQTFPSSIGKINQVVVIADQEVWEGPIGDSLRYYLESPYLLLPQPEPIYDLKHFTVQDLQEQPIRKELRTMLIAGDLSDLNSPTTRMILDHMGEENQRRATENPTFRSTIAQDKWAKNQLLIYTFGFGKKDLINGFIRQFQAIKKQIDKFDRPNIEANVFQTGENLDLAANILNNFDVAIRIPKSYTTAIENEDFIWLREDTRKSIMNIMLHRFPYTNKTQLTGEGLKNIRNQLGQTYITSNVEGSFMKINDRDLPCIIRNLNRKEQYALEARGIWEMSNDFMGGCFVSYLIHNPDKNELLFADGFVYGPGEDKREPLQELEFILSTIDY